MSRLTFISAGAGSGKTHTLTTKLSELLHAGTVRPSGVIATTFTKKAATELRERVRQRLLSEGRFNLANAMGQARIGTVNSICGNLLERFAFEAGLATRQQVLEEGQARILIREAIDAARNGEQVAALSRLANRLGVEDWSAVLAELVNQARANDIDLALLPGFAQENADDLLSQFQPLATDDLSAELLKRIDAALPELRIAAASGTKKNTKEYVSHLTDFRQRLADDDAAWGEWIALSKKQPEKSLHKPHPEAIQALARKCPAHPELHADIRAYLAQMFSLCAEALAHYSERKRGLGVVDFADQEHLLLKLLDKPEVCDVLREELDLLLVDEFQDTSPIQLALFIKLAGLAKQTYWVGDIKQAIYGFRGSDTALMQAILHDLERFDGVKQILDFSWRSRPALVSLVNAVFTQSFAATLEPEEIALTAKRAEAAQEPAFANWLLTGKNVDQRTQALALGVKELLASGMQIPGKADNDLRTLHASDIAILSRSHDGVSKIALALRQAGIPAATAQPGLLTTPEATLALACLRRLNDTGDTVATAEILSLADSTDPEDWLADRLAYIASGADKKRWREEGENAHPLIAKIAALRSQLPLLAPREALRKVIAEGNLSRVVLRWRQDPAIARLRLANLEALLALADKYEDSCRGTRQAATLSGLILWLGEQAKAGEDALALPGVDAVNVMTHHAAKGLEWPVVILADLEKSFSSRLWSVTTRSRNAIDAMNPLKDRFIRYWPWPFGKQREGIDEAEKIKKSEVAQQFTQEARDEGLRLLYVSMTRPRDLLILARQEKKGDGGWIADLDAKWLLPDAEIGAELTLPDGTKIPYQHRELTAPEEAISATLVNQPVSWFQTLTATQCMPLFFNPSSAEKVQSTVLEKVRIGERIQVSPGVDWATLGTAIHACLAASFTDPACPITESEVGDILTGFKVGDAVLASAVLGQIHAFHAWIKQRWPNYTPMAEAFATQRMENGQLLNGRIDLLLDTPEGYVLIDHKSAPLAMDKWDGLVEEYGGQLAAYVQAVEQLTNWKVVERWLFLPVAGGGGRVT